MSPIGPIFFTEILKQLFDSRLKENEPMSRHTNFRIGGPARWFVEAKTEEEILQAVGIARDAGVPVFVLGGGSNTLASDAGFPGLVLVMGMRRIVFPERSPAEPDEVEGFESRPSTSLASGSLRSGNKFVVAEAGAMSAALARATADAGLRGLEWMISLPGTVGGAVRGNAGCFGGETSDHLVSVRVLRCIPPCPRGGQGGVGACKVIELLKKDLRFAYRESALKHSSDILLSVVFELPCGEKLEFQKKMSFTLETRKAKQPLYAGSAGCIFKNYEMTDETDIVKLKEAVNIPKDMLDVKHISAGWIVDQLDLKGTKIGGAEISREHGNFIINTGNATADDVVQLIALIKTRARNEFGIALQEEVQYVGFD